MKKRGILLLAALLVVLLCCLLVACASENAAEAVHSDSVGLLAGGAQVQPLPDINLKIDASELSRPYNARPVNYPSYTSDISEPRVEIVFYQKIGGEYVTISDPPTYVGEYRVTVYVEPGMEYTGEDTVDFAITPAYFKPASKGEFRYTGASVFAVDSVLACGEDRISYEIAFDGPNVGAEISYIRFYGDHAENYRMDPAYTAEILPAKLDISHLNTLSVQKRYDATDLARYTLDHNALSGILKGETATVVLSTGLVDVCAQTQLTATVLRSENPNYEFSGTVSLLLSIEKAVFTPPAEVTYTGSRTITLKLPTGLGEDVLTVTMIFASKNVGAALLKGGVHINGEKVGNYQLAENYTVSIRPKRLQLPEQEEIHAQKRFDGTDRLMLVLHTGLSAEPTVEVVGTVPQIFPCAETKVLFRVHEDNNPNYLIEGEFELYLTVQKALLKLSGAPAFTYNGYAERYIGMDSEFVEGGAANYPVGMAVIFEGDDPDAKFLRVAVYGENSVYYEVDYAEFTPAITPAKLCFNVSSIAFAANGEQTRVLRGGRSLFLTAIAQGDKVYALLTFSSAEKGATLVDAKLYGADAHKYVPDIDGFTAVIE